MRAAFSRPHSWRLVRIDLKDGAAFEFEGAEVTGHTSSPQTPPWEKLLVFATAAGGHVAARGWSKRDPRQPMIWTAREVSTVADAMDVWGWTPLAREFASTKLKIDVD